MNELFVILNWNHIALWNTVSNTDLLLRIMNENKTNLIKKVQNVIYSISFLDNPEITNKFNVSTIDIGECEGLLREKYDLGINDTLFIFKIEYFEDYLYFPIIRYQIYTDKIKEELNMEFCKDIKIIVNSPVSVDENFLFKHDPSNPYYTDICYFYTTNDNADIILSDRKKEFNKNNMSLCESNCIYKSYNSLTKKVTCECQAKSISSFFSEIYNNKDKLIKKFSNIKDTVNIEIIKCYYSLFTKNGLKSNVGNYVLISIIFIECVLTILFILKGYSKFNNYAKEIILNEEENKNTLNHKNINAINKVKKIKKVKTKTKKKKINFDKKIDEMKSNPPKIKKGSKKKIARINNDTINFKNIQITNVIDSSKKENKDNSIFPILNNNKIKKYNDYELNNFSYKDALQLDKRVFSQYYLSLLKYNQIIIFTFYTNNDYNSKIIKISLFLLLFSSYYAVNALFFDNSTIHTIYLNKGKYDFVYLVPQIIYSSIICSIIKVITSYFSLTEKDIIYIKKKEENKNETITKLFKCLLIKFLIFYILTYIFLILFWYYLSCFCAVYQNSQIHLIKDTLISYLLSLLYPFGFCLIPCSFRLIALRAKNADKEFLYKFSIILQII